MPKKHDFSREDELMSSFRGFGSSEEELEKIDVEELPLEVKQQIVYINDEDLLDDEINAQYYGHDLDVIGLSHVMKTNGFQGVILAYPLDGRDKGKYRIEGGHRRRLAGRMAGITKFPVYVTEAPKTEWERKLRLIGNNLHSRGELSPMRKAFIAQELYEAHQQEVEHKKECGLLKPDDITGLNDLVAIDLEISKKMVEKYRRLLKLVPKLQSMADDGKYSWTAISEASTLTTAEQLYIAEQIENVGAGMADQKWIVSLIKQVKNDGMIKNASDAVKTSEIVSHDPMDEIAELMERQPEEKKKTRTRDGIKKLTNGVAAMNEVMDGVMGGTRYRIKDEDTDKTISLLQGVSEKINQMISELENRK